MDSRERSETAAKSSQAHVCDGEIRWNSVRGLKVGEMRQRNTHTIGSLSLSLSLSLRKMQKTEGARRPGVVFENETSVSSKSARK